MTQRRLKNPPVLNVEAFLPPAQFVEAQRVAREFGIDPTAPQWIWALLVRLLADRGEAPRSRHKTGPDRRHLAPTWGEVSLMPTPETEAAHENEPATQGWQFHEAGPRAELFETIEARRCQGHQILTICRSLPNDTKYKAIMATYRPRVNKRKNAPPDPKEKMARALRQSTTTSASGTPRTRANWISVSNALSLASNRATLAGIRVGAEW
jgi:hypothetical protein